MINWGSRSVGAVWGRGARVAVVGSGRRRRRVPRSRGLSGHLVVEPAGGSGLLLVGANGAHPRQICTVRPRCDPATDPVWSPDGSEIAFASPGRSGLSVIYPDGSCLSCPASALAYWFPVDQRFGLGFLPDGRLAVRVDQPFDLPPRQLGAMKTDGIGFQRFKVSGDWQQPAWSPTGQLAAVRLVKGKPEVFVVDPATGSARQLTLDGASSPSWSPDGRRLAVVHRGWIELIGSDGRRLRRLTRGGAPAWAPDGKRLAFVGAHRSALCDLGAGWNAKARRSHSRRAS